MSADPTKLRKTKEFDPQGIAFCIARGAEPGRFYFGSSDFRVYEWDANAEKPEPVPMSGPGHESYVVGVERTADAIVSAGFDGRLIWWNPQTRERVREVQGHERWIRRLAASPDGRLLVTVADDMLCKVWDAATGEPVRTHPDHAVTTPHHFPSMLYAVAVSPDGKFAATGDRVGHVVVRDLATGEKAGEVEAPAMYTWDPKARIHSIGGVRSLAFSPDSSRLAVGGMGQVGNIDHLEGKARVEVFDWRAGTRLVEVEDEKFKGLVERLAFGPAGDWLVAAGGDSGGFMSIYAAADGKPIAQEKAPSHVHDFAWSDGFETLHTACHGKIAAWELT